MTGDGDRPEAAQRRRILWTALVLGAVALGFYIGFILVTAANT